MTSITARRTICWQWLRSSAHRILLKRRKPTEEEWNALFLSHPFMFFLPWRHKVTHTSACPSTESSVSSRAERPNISSFIICHLKIIRDNWLHMSQIIKIVIFYPGFSKQIAHILNQSVYWCLSAHGVAVSAFRSLMCMEWACQSHITVHS